MKQRPLIAGILLMVVAVQAGCGPARQESDGKSGTTAAPAAASGYYAEESHKGRLYVFGTERAHAQMKESGHAPQIAQTFIGAGPEGQTLVLEADAKTNDLQERLKAQYESKHGTKLP